MGFMGFIGLLVYGFMGLLVYGASPGYSKCRSVIAFVHLVKNLRVPCGNFF